MDKAKDYFKGKKVTVMGLGLLGRGIGDARYLAEAGAEEVIVTDLKSEADLALSVKELSDLPNIVFHLGGHRAEDFQDRDLVLVAAGVPMTSPYLAIAREHGVPLAQSAALFARLSLIPIIGVTGTRGKSTVTHMIHHVLSYVTGEKVLLGGNVRGLSNLQLLKEVKEDSLCVMELDSWQLQGFGWAEISPQVAVFTSFMEDHLNYYQAGGLSKEEGMKLYFTDKAQIFLHQDESGSLITTPEVFSWIKQVFPEVSLGQELILADSSVIPEEAILAMPGEHNRLNAALAFEALQVVGLSEEEIFAGLATFPGVPGRLEYLGTVSGVSVYNDNNATTPAALAAGVKAVASQGPVVLLAGGADKGIPLAETIAALQVVKHCVLLAGTGTERLLQELPENLQSKCVVVDALEPGVAAALDAATPGDVLLFSPGFASFGLFKNEYERNDLFVKIVTELEHDEA